MSDKSIIKTPATDISAAKAAEIRKLHVSVCKTIGKGAQLAFLAGQELTEVFTRMHDASEWKDWVEHTLKMGMSTVRRYIALYERFRDNPKEIEDLTIEAALGVKRASAEKGRIEYGNPDRQYEFDWEAAFAKPPISKAKLKDHRFECPDNRSIWLVKRGINYPVKFLDLFSDEPNDTLKFPYEDMMKKIQGAVEMYFQEVEKIEKTEEVES